MCVCVWTHPVHGEVDAQRVVQLIQELDETISLLEGRAESGELSLTHGSLRDTHTRRGFDRVSLFVRLCLNTCAVLAATKTNEEGENGKMRRNSFFF